MYQFEHEGKKIKLLPLWPKAWKFDQKATALKKKRVNLISAKDLHLELKNSAPFMIFSAIEVEKTDSTIPL